MATNSFKVTAEGRVGWECGVEDCTRAHPLETSAAACRNNPAKKNKDVKLQEIMERRRKYLGWAERMLRGEPCTQIAKDVSRCAATVNDKISQVFRVAHAIHRKHLGTELVPDNRCPSPVEVRNHLKDSDSIDATIALLETYWVPSKALSWSSNVLLVWGITRDNNERERWRTANGYKQI